MASPQLAATVYVQDPETHQTVTLAEGTCPPPHLAALVTNQAAWVDGKLPRLKTQTPPKDPSTDPQGGSDPNPQDGGGPGADDDPAAASGGDGDPDDPADPASSDGAAEPKPAAKKAATGPARGRKAAGEGNGGQ
ncbi:hypothetical protein ABZ404_36800 [Streptomyces sp. NPDC005878]|uniref:hypothetical protein n=1 Tax=Streptomyces sp. NPDC005878 TaxID=3157077 RepID=UPI0033E13131